MFNLIYDVRVCHLVVIDPFFHVVTSTCIIIRWFETINWTLGWVISYPKWQICLQFQRLCNGNWKQKRRNQMWKVSVDHLKVQPSVGQLSQTPLSIIWVSLRHPIMIPLGYYHKWYPDWKSNYQFSLVWELNVRIGFWKKKTKKIWELGKVWPLTWVKVLGFSCQ
jgi:hypothetical protein